MTDHKYPNIGISGPFCKGFYLYCNFGLTHLVCRPHHLPDDPLLPSPMMQMWASDVYGLQFLSQLHQWKNDLDILEQVFCYTCEDEYTLARYNKQQIIEQLALQLLQRKLVIIPLDSQLRLPEVGGSNNSSDNFVKALVLNNETSSVNTTGIKPVTTNSEPVIPIPAEPTNSLDVSKQQAITYWQNLENNADTFPEAFGAHLMKLNAEAGYGIAEGAKSTYETLTSWDKFSAAAAGLVHTVTNPVETFNAIQGAAETFADLPVGEQGEAAYKVLVGGLATAGVGKVATTGGKLAPSKVRLLASKIPSKDYMDIRNRSVHNPDANSLILGKYTPTIKDGVEDWKKPGPDSYVTLANNEKATYFSLGSEWDSLKIKYDLTDDEMFDNFNIPVLDDAVTLNKEIKFTHNPLDYKGAILKEWQYLKNTHGYTRLKQIGDFYYAK